MSNLVRVDFRPPIVQQMESLRNVCDEIWDPIISQSQKDLAAETGSLQKINVSSQIERQEEKHQSIRFHLRSLFSLPFLRIREVFLDLRSRYLKVLQGGD